MSETLTERIIELQDKIRDLKRRLAWYEKDAPRIAAEAVVQEYFIAYGNGIEIPKKDIEALIRRALERAGKEER